jgi:arylsulfatase A
MNHPSRRQFLKIAGVAACAATSGCMSQSLGMARDEKGGRPPNVLLIMTDDQGWGDFHSHGNDKIDTPVLDKLASEGARFERFFVSPVCAPTRAGLLTGRYHLRTGTHGVTRTYETMREEEVTLAEAMNRLHHRLLRPVAGRALPHNPNGKGSMSSWPAVGQHYSTRRWSTTASRSRLAAMSPTYSPTPR